MSYGQSLDPRRRPVSTIEPAQGDRNVAQPWGAVQGLGFLILRNVRRVDEASAISTVNRAHGQIPPTQIAYAVYSSTSVEYNGREVHTEPMSCTQLAALLELYIHRVTQARARIDAKLAESSTIGHERAAAMVFVQCKEGNLNGPSQNVSKADPIHDRDRQFSTTSSPHDLPRRPPSAKPAEQEHAPREKSTTPTIRPRDLTPKPYAKWGVLEAIAYELMVNVLDFSVREIAATIYFDRMRTQVIAHFYPPVDIEYRGVRVRTRALRHLDIVSMVKDFLQTGHDSSTRVRHYFSTDDKNGHLIAAAMVYFSSTSADRIQPYRNGALDDFSRGSRVREREDFSLSQRITYPSKGQDRAVSQALSKAPYETVKWQHWKVLDVIACLTMDIALLWTPYRIASTKVGSSLDDVKALLDRSDKLDEVLFEGQKVKEASLTVPSMKYRDIKQLVRNFRSHMSGRDKDDLLNMLEAKTNKTYQQLSSFLNLAIIVYNDTTPSDRSVSAIASIESKVTQPAAQQAILNNPSARQASPAIASDPGRTSNSDAPAKTPKAQEEPLAHEKPIALATPCRRIVESWHVLDIITFEVMSQHLKSTAELIASVLDTRLADIQSVLRNLGTGSCLLAKTWPSRELQFRGQKGHTQELRTHDVTRLVSLYMAQDDPTRYTEVLERTRKLYTTIGRGQAASTTIYCETFPKLTKLSIKVRSGRPVVASDSDGRPSTAGSESAAAKTDTHDTAITTNTTGSVPTADPVANKKRIKKWSVLNNIQKRSRLEHAPSSSQLELVPIGKMSVQSMSNDLSAPKEQSQLNGRSAESENDPTKADAIQPSGSLAVPLPAKPGGFHSNPLFLDDEDDDDGGPLDVYDLDEDEGRMPIAVRSDSEEEFEASEGTPAWPPIVPPDAPPEGATTGQ